MCVAMHIVHLSLIGKRVYFLLVIIELFSLSVIRLRRYERKLIEKSAFWKALASFGKIFAYKGKSPPKVFAWIDRPMNALQLCR